MSPACEGPASARRTGPSENATARKHLAPQSTGQNDTPALLDPVVDSHAYGRTTALVPSEYVLGPGSRQVTTGPEDAEAPAWWRAEAERVVLALIDSGHSVTADDLHERYPHEPSTSGAAIGALFAGLARAGRVREIGMVRSRRSEARRRRIIQWGAP
jgi:hypothetical protein